MFSGAAVSYDKGQTFEKIADTPVLDRNPKEACRRTVPFILKDEAMYKMWYTTSLSLEQVELENPVPFLRWTVFPKYNITNLNSVNGIVWGQGEEYCLGFHEGEFGLARPWVVKENELYRMWYSIRSIEKPYQIGYAESPDGICWCRKDEEAGIEASETGWDSEMVCFASVIKTGGNNYMFYNGNSHGRDGFGYAIGEE